MSEWNARRILKELAPAEQRRAILADFWRYAEPEERAAALAYLARKLHFRDVTLRKLPPEKKGELLAARANDPETEHFLGMALMQYHLHRAQPLMAAFLDEWKIPHKNGMIEGDVTAPDTAAVHAALAALGDRFPAAEARLYLATAGLLMGDDWAEATWPVVDELAPGPAAADE
jgi:hypothetical protein